MALGFLLAACQNSATDLSLSSGDELVLSLASGGTLEGTVGSDAPVRIQVSDSRGRPIEGVSVEFRVLGQDGKVTPTLVRSDAGGIAEADWTLGARAGEQVLEVAGVDNRRPQERIRIHLPARANPGDPLQLEVSQQALTMMVGEQRPLTARVVDAHGNTVEGIPLTWSLPNDQVVSLVGANTIRAVAPGRTVIEVEATIEADVIQQAGPYGMSAAQAPGNGGGKKLKESTEIIVEEPALAPGAVTDLAVATRSNTSVTLRFTQVDDGTGRPSDYAIRVGTPHFNMSWNGRASTEQVVKGTAIGSEMIYEFTGLIPQTDYAFRVAALRTALDGSVVYGAVSPSVSAQTLSEAPPLDEDEKEPESYTLMITPSSLTLQGVDSEGQLSATVTDSSQKILEGATVTWSSLSESIVTVTAAGLVQARALGTGLIVASAACCGTSDTITVFVGETTVTPAPEQVTDLQVASTEEAAVVLRWTEVNDGTGQPAKYAIRHQTPNLVWWEAVSSEVAVGGKQVGAPMEYRQNSLNAGTTYEFRLVSYRGDLENGATFGGLSNVIGATTVQGHVAPEPEQNPDQEWHEPLGFTPISNLDFSSLSGTGWGLMSYVDGGFGLTQLNGSSVGRFTYPAGFRDGHSPAMMWRGTGGVQDIYLRFRVMRSENWSTHPVFDKLIYITDSTLGGGGDPAFIGFVGNRFEVRKQGPTGAANYAANRATVNVPTGQWATIEVRLITGTNGQIHAWVDGQKTHEYFGVNWSDSSPSWDTVKIDPIWGGNVGALVPATQHLYFSSMYVSGR